MGSSISLPANPGIYAWEWRWIGILQAFFLIIALFGLDGPFVSMHFVRQNQTADVAHHVYREGWSAVIAPKASFSELYQPDDIFSAVVVPTPRFTIIHLEVPFHGIIGWPAAQVFRHHERAVVRLVSVAFAIISIRIFFLIVRRWVDPYPALAGTTLWATAPLIVHFGQVPTPDILATTGMAVAFFFALRGNLAPSSGAFLFALLAKLSIIIYGLPILVALLVAKECRSTGQFIKLSVLWGAAPLLSVLIWISLSRHDPYGSWVITGGFRPGNFGSLQVTDLLHPGFYLAPLIYLLPFGLGILGLTGLAFALRSHPPRMNFWIKGAILFALLCNYVVEKIVWAEPQYTVPVIFWTLLAASFGLPLLFEKMRESHAWRFALATLLLLHFAIAGYGIVFLKASRMPNLGDVQAAALHTPADARIVVYAGTPNASPSNWLDRNTMTLIPLGKEPHPGMLDALDKQLEKIHRVGFDYLLVFDVEEHHRGNPFGTAKPNYDTDYTVASSPVRRYFDGKYQKIYEGDHVVLYQFPRN
jgi:hypothetical protein